MGELAETAIEQELALMGSGFESRLTRTVELLRSARRAVLDEDIESFAKAEVTEDDPLQSRHLGHQDPLGVSSAFARSME